MGVVEEEEEEEGRREKSSTVGFSPSQGSCRLVQQNSRRTMIPGPLLRGVRQKVRMWLEH